jgi:hypothetical protein
MRTILILSALILTSLPGAAVLSSGSVLAQDAPTASGECWNSSQRYSPGSTIRMGDAVYICRANSPPNWEVSSEGGANCTYEDRSYTAGAVVAVKDAVITCQADGTWAK